VILDLEGSPAQRAISPRLGSMLSIASGAVAAAALLIMAALPHPHDSPPLFVQSGTSILEQALAKPKPPTLELRLPSDLAVEVQPLTVDGIYGPARPEPTLRSFRLRETNALVVVAMLPSAPAIVPPSNLPTDALSVHGEYAANYSVEATSISAVRWSEDGMTYEVSSRALLLRDLVRLAEQVR
jgi:hypothetical protein